MFGQRAFGAIMMRGRFVQAAANKNSLGWFPIFGAAANDVPGPYTMVTDVGPIARDKCPQGGLYKNDTLCCIEKGEGKWRCRQVEMSTQNKEQTTPDKPDTCLRAIQLYYTKRQELPYSAVTGKWNKETEVALSSRFPSPKDYAGGPCAMLTMLTIRPDAPSMTSAGIAQQIPGGMMTVAAVGVAALAAIIYARAPA